MVVRYIYFRAQGKLNPAEVRSTFINLLPALGSRGNVTLSGARSGRNGSHASKPDIFKIGDITAEWLSKPRDIINPTST